MTIKKVFLRKKHRPYCKEKNIGKLEDCHLLLNVGKKVQKVPMYGDYECCCAIIAGYIGWRRRTGKK